MFFGWFVKDKKKQQQKKKRGGFKQKPALASFFFHFITGWVDFLFLGTTSDINITKIEKFNPVVMQKDQ
jgi:hypothetical protein